VLVREAGSAVECEMLERWYETGGHAAGRDRNDLAMTRTDAVARAFLAEWRRTDAGSVGATR
jgi:hypothetical protein